MRRVKYAVLGGGESTRACSQVLMCLGSFAAAFAFWRQFRDKRWLRYGMMIYAVLIAFTKYAAIITRWMPAAGFVVAIIRHVCCSLADEAPSTFFVA